MKVYDLSKGNDKDFEVIFDIQGDEIFSFLYEDGDLYIKDSIDCLKISSNKPIEYTLDSLEKCVSFIKDKLKKQGHQEELLLE